MCETQHFPVCVHLCSLTSRGLEVRVAYQLNYVFRIQIRSLTYKPRGFLPGTYSKSMIYQPPPFRGWPPR